MLLHSNDNVIPSRKNYVKDCVKLKVEGADELALLCPVSKLTGFPMSMQQAIFMISDKNDRLAEVLFQEIPAVRASEDISDTDKLKLLVSRLDSGSFAENDNVAEILGNIAKEFFPDADAKEVVDKAVDKIKFDADSANQAVDNV